MSDYTYAPYEVGKGKPPREHQFKKGQSGNPKGRRHKKNARGATLEVLAFEAVNEMVPVVIRGREVRLPKKQAIVLGVVNDALTGTPAQRLKAMQALHEIGAFKAAVEDERMTPEMREEAANNLIAVLIEEGKRDAEMRHLFAHYP
jgi:hypothetical protein